MSRGEHASSTVPDEDVELAPEDEDEDEDEDEVAASPEDELVLPPVPLLLLPLPVRPLEELPPSFESVGATSSVMPHAAMQVATIVAISVHRTDCLRIPKS